MNAYDMETVTWWLNPVLEEFADIPAVQKAVLLQVPNFLALMAENLTEKQIETVVNNPAVVEAVKAKLPDATTLEARIGYLSDALKQVLIADGVLMRDAKPNGAELLLAAEEYVKGEA